MFAAPPRKSKFNAPPIVSPSSVPWPPKNPPAIRMVVVDVVARLRRVPLLDTSVPLAPAPLTTLSVPPAKLNNAFPRSTLVPSSVKFVLAERSMVAEKLMAPLLALPITSVGAVIRSSSVSVKPRVPAESAPPKLIAWLFVCCFSVTLAAETSVEVALKFMLSLVSVMVPAPEVVRSAPAPTDNISVVTDKVLPAANVISPLRLTVSVPAAPLIVSELNAENGIVSVLSPLLSVPPAGAAKNRSLASLMTRFVPDVVTVSALFFPDESVSVMVKLLEASSTAESVGVPKTVSATSLPTLPPSLFAK